jgi:hypothetical protein
MDQKIALLSALCLLGQTGTSASERNLRHLRVVMSSFGEEILSEDEYGQIINSLKEDGYLEKGDRVLVTREGAALVHAVGERVLGSTALDRLDKMIDDYSKEGNKYIQRLNEQLQSLQATRETKVEAVNRFSVRVVGLIVEVRHARDDLHVQTFRLDQQIMRNEEKLDSEINYQVRKLTKETGYPIIARRDDNLLQIIAPATLPSFSIFGQELSVTTVEIIGREDVPQWNRTVVAHFMENSLYRLGYLRTYWPGRTFVKYRSFKHSPTSAGGIRESEGLRLDFQEMQGDQVFVWVETFTAPTKRVLDLLHDSGVDITDETAILSCLGGFRLRSIPSGSVIELKGVLPDRDLAKERVPTTDFTFLEFWERTHGIELTEQVQPILVVEGFDGDLHYPAEMVYVDRYSLEKHFGKLQRKPKPETPKERYEKIQDLFYSIRDLYIKLGASLEVIPRRYAPTIQELYELGALGEVVRIRPPMLRFCEGQVSIDPLDVFSRDYVPICGRKNVALTHIAVPLAIKDDDIDTFVHKLHIRFRAFGFGKIQQAEDVRVIRYDEKADIQELESKIRDLERVEGGNNVTVAVLPGDNGEHYYSLKRLLPSRTGAPLQCVQLSTFREILSGSFRGFRYLCMKVLIKVLREGESIWNLCNAAGLLQENTLYVGIGFSRYPRERKVSKCAAVLHSARGERVSWKVFATLQERTISKQWFDTLLRRVRKIIENEKPSRLVFYRNGQMSPRESDAIRSSLQGFDWLSGIKTNFVSVIDSSNHRFYLYDIDRDRYQNLPAGYAVLLDDKQGFLSSSNYDERELRQGTVIPVCLKLEIGNEEIVDLLKEYHDLTYLNWQAPATTAKHPLVLTVADRFAELTREGVSSESMFYLDL